MLQKAYNGLGISKSPLEQETQSQANSVEGYNYLPQITAPNSQVLLQSSEAQVHPVSLNSSMCSYMKLILAMMLRSQYPKLFRSILLILKSPYSNNIVNKSMSFVLA